MKKPKDESPCLYKAPTKKNKQEHIWSQVVRAPKKDAPRGHSDGRWQGWFTQDCQARPL